MSGQLYGSLIGAGDGTKSFRYAPAVAQLLVPFGWMPFAAFYGLLAAVNLTALVFLLGPALAAVSLLWPPVAHQVAQGNIELLLAVGLVVGMRSGMPWAFLLMTKVTPGIGLLWFPCRRQWKHLAVALTVTVAVAIPCLLLAPDLWGEWVRHLAANAWPRAECWNCSKRSAGPTFGMRGTDRCACCVAKSAGRRAVRGVAGSTGNLAGIRRSVAGGVAARSHAPEAERSSQS